MWFVLGLALLDCVKDCIVDCIVDCRGPYTASDSYTAGDWEDLGSGWIETIGSERE